MRLGPVSGATVIVRNLGHSIAAYADQLGLVVVDRDRLPRQRALDMGDATLADAPMASLRAPVDNVPWLTLIEMPDAPLAGAFARRGWMAMRLMVSDVDEFAERLDRRFWRVLSAGAVDDDGSRSLWVAGADGEVLQLTALVHVSASLQLPPSRSAVDRICGATLGARDCASALGFYEGLGLVNRWRRTAPMPAREAAPGNDRANLCAQALAQLRASNVIEIDQLPWLPAADSTLRTGLRMLSFERSDASGRRLAANDDPSARILAGPEGEAIELV